MKASHSKSVFEGLGKKLYDYFLPTKKDSIIRIVYKMAFFVLIITFAITPTRLFLYFRENNEQIAVTQSARDIWYGEVTKGELSRFSKLKKENSDFSGWIKIDGTLIDHPFYQTDNDEFYLNHNRLGEQSRHGAVFLSSEDNPAFESGDKNLVIYGHNMKDGSMFGTLKELRKLSFYKDHPTVSLSLSHHDYTYVIYSVFLLNANADDDKGYIYNIAKSSFSKNSEFKNWIDEAYARSIIYTGVEVNRNDNILTLVTHAEDFENARLVVMARRLRNGESPIISTSGAMVNPSARYPKIWYDSRGIKFPQTKND